MLYSGNNKNHGSKSIFSINITLRQNNNKLKPVDITSKGVRGHFPLILIAPGRITRPGFVNFPFQPLSLASFMSSFSCSPPSKIQQEKATISCSCQSIIWACNLDWDDQLSDHYKQQFCYNTYCGMKANLLKSKMHWNVFTTMVRTAFLHSWNQCFPHSQYRTWKP